MEKNLTFFYNTPGKRIKYLRGIIGLSREYIYQKYNISVATLRKWESRNEPLSEQSVNRCLDFLKKEDIITTKEWINAGIGAEPKFISSKQNILQMSTNDSSNFYDNDLAIVNDANNFKLSYNDAVVMMVTGNEMKPFFSPGDYVGGRFVATHATDDYLGKDCIILLEDSTKLFRRVYQTKNELINLSCLNPTIDEPVIYNVSIYKIAPVIWHRKYKP